MRKWLTMIACGLLLAGCGTKGAVLLTVESPQNDGAALAIPADVDTLHVSMRAPGDDSVVLEKDYPLDGQKFPVTLGIEAGDYEDEQLKVEVHAKKGEQVVAEATAIVQFDSEELTSFTIRLIARH